jgi:hypothetical protein
MTSRTGPALELARQLIRQAAIEDVRPEIFLVEVVGAAIASIRAAQGPDWAKATARGIGRGCLKMVRAIDAEDQG